MKDEVDQIIGKRITGVVIKEHVKAEGQPRGQLFLIFDDNTWYEFYVPFDHISTTGGVCQGGLDDVMSYMKEPMRPVWVGYRGDAK